MYRPDDMILELSETYKAFTEKQVELYRKEFNKYDEFTLRKITECIIDNHEQNNIPVLGKVFSYMKMAHIQRKKSTERFSMVCSTCNTKFYIKTAYCPSCAWKGQLDKSVVYVSKSLDYPSDIKFINRLCVHCTKFIGNKNIPCGAKCDGWRSNATVKTGKDCINCECKDCCNEQIRDLSSEVHNNLVKEK